MANRSVQSFLHRSRQNDQLYNGRRLFPRNCPFTCDLDPIQFVISLAHPSPQPKRHHNRFSRFCTDDRRVSLYFTMGCSFPPQNCPFPWGSWPHLIHGYIDLPESSAQTASRSVQPLIFAGLTSVTDRPTDRPRYSVGNNRPHLHT